MTKVMAAFRKANQWSFHCSFKRYVVVILLVSTLRYSAGHKQGRNCLDCRRLLWRRVCCNKECVLGSNCLGRSCKSIFDCHEKEACCSGICKNVEDCNGDLCTSNFDCGRKGLCCISSFDEKKCGDNCIGALCWKKTDCAPKEFCCNNKCSTTPCGQCNTDSDCSSVSPRCCQGVCTARGAVDCFDQTTLLWSVIAFIGLLLLFFVSCNCYCHGHRHCFATDETSLGEESVPSYPLLSLPSYEQSCPDSPPPEYEQEERISVAPRYPLDAERSRGPYRKERGENSRGDPLHYSTYGALEGLTV